MFADTDSLSSTELITMLATNYCLEDAVVDRIKLYTTTFIGDNGNTKDVKLDDMVNLFEQEIRCDKNKTLPKVNVIIHDINLRVRYRCKYSTGYVDRG